MGYLAARLSTDQPSKNEKEKVIGAVRTAVLERCEPQAIYLFGSILTVDFTFASDVDIAVIFRDSARAEKARQRLFAGPPLISLPYDLLIYTQGEFDRRAKRGGICQVIQESGRQIL